MIMKRVIPVLLTLLFSLSSFADETTHSMGTKKNLGLGLSINPGALVFLGYSGKLQIGLGNYLSLVVPIYYQDFKYTPKNAHEVNFIRFNAGLGARIHLGETRMESSFYIEPTLRFGTTKIGKNAKGQYALTPEILCGYAWLFDNGFSISAGIGAEYEYLLGDDEMGAKHMKDKGPGFTKMPLSGELSIGWVI